MRSLAALALAILIAAPAAAETWTPEAVRSALSGWHEVPSHDYWRAEGPAARDALLAVAMNPAARTMHRSRAIAALGAFDDAAVRATLAALALDPGERLIYRNIAVEALAHVAGEDALDVLRETVSAPRATMREASVRALAQIDTAEARALVAASAAADAAPEVRAAAAKALAR